MVTEKAHTEMIWRKFAEMEAEQRLIREQVTELRATVEQNAAAFNGSLKETKEVLDRIIGLMTDKTNNKTATDKGVSEVDAAINDQQKESDDSEPFGLHYIHVC